MTDLGPSLGVPFDTAQAMGMLGAMIIFFPGDLARTAIASQTLSRTHQSSIRSKRLERFELFERLEL
jgi:hypothetical protein